MKQVMSAYFLIFELLCMGRASADDQPEMDSVYIEESRQAFAPHWQTSLGLSMDLSDPLLEIYELRLLNERQWSPFWKAGLKVSWFISLQSGSEKDLVKRLSQEGIDSRLLKPIFEIQPTLTFVPVSGKLNLLNETIWEMSLLLRIAPGIVFYSEDKNFDVLGFDGGIETVLSSHFNLALTYTYELEGISSNQLLTRNRLGGALTYLW